MNTRQITNIETNLLKQILPEKFKDYGISSHYDNQLNVFLQLNYLSDLLVSIDKSFPDVFQDYECLIDDEFNIYNIMTSVENYITDLLRSVVTEINDNINTDEIEFFSFRVRGMDEYYTFEAPNLISGTTNIPNMIADIIYNSDLDIVKYDDEDNSTNIIFENGDKVFIDDVKLIIAKIVIQIAKNK